MLNVVTLGEAMLRLSPPNFRRLEQATSFDVHIGGSELNVAIGVKRLGLESAWVTKLPKSPLGRLIRNKARELGVDTSHIVWSNEGRAGIYFLEFGATPRPSMVIYDRAGSAASMLRPGEVDWDFLEEVKLFHVSGITPALSQTCKEATVEAIKAAKKAGCKVSFDVNYRSRLWTTEEAESCLSPLMKEVDVLITTDQDAWRVWKMKGTPEEIITRLKEKFGCPVVAITLREIISTWRGAWTSMAIADRIYRSTKKYEMEIVDRIGGGDAYTAGFLYGYLIGDIQKGIDYGDAMSAFKHSFPGDCTYMTYEEVNEAVKATMEMRIQR